MEATLLGSGLSHNELNAVEQAVAEKTDGCLIDYQAVDIAFFDEDGEEIEPAKPIIVTFTSPLVDTDDQPYVVHVEDLTNEEVQAMADGEDEPERTASVIDALDDDQLDKRDLTLDVDQLVIESERFSTYVLALTTIEKTLEASDGGTYHITVTAPAAAGVSQDVTLKAEEIDPDKDADTYESYVSQVESVLGWELGTASYARLFDISLVDADDNEIQPADGSSVSVDIQLADKDSDTAAQVVHFGDEPEVIEAETENNTVSFEATGFSVYAIVDTPDSTFEEAGEHTARLNEYIDEHGGEGFYLSNKKRFFTGETADNVVSASSGTGLLTTTTDSDTIAPEAIKFYFERVGASDAATATGNEYLIYKLDREEPQYLRMSRVNDSYASLSFTNDRDESTAFTVAYIDSNGAYQISGVAGGNIYYWSYKSKDPGKGTIVGYKNADGNVVKLKLHYVVEPAESEPYGLEGTSYGIAYHDENVTSSALTTDADVTKDGKSRLKGKKMLMRPDVFDNDGVLLVSGQNVDIQMWNFEWVSENRYHLTTMVDGVKHYLTISGSNATLAPTPDETKSLIAVTPGTGTHTNAWHLTVGGYSLAYSGSVFYGATGSDNKTWLNLVTRLDDFTEDDFHTYTAKKVSISDTTNVYDGQQVVIYTRIWNNTTKKYEFYAVDHDGSLIRCYDTGDGIEWIGSKVNSALWKFTEYRDWKTNKPNYYYELQNVQTGDYIAPQLKTDKPLRDSTIGVNLNGRRYGKNYSTIIAWDDDETVYAYCGIKAENGRIVSSPLAEADDFYFAIMHEVDSSQELSTVETVDSSAYGITMKMYKWNDVDTVANRERTQMNFFGSPTKLEGRDSNTTTDNNRLGLLSTDLGAGPDGSYPMATSLTNAGKDSPQPLSNIFTNGQEANHLFIESVYNESGYFEYSSTSNFAHFNTEGENAGNFTVYDQLASCGDYYKTTRVHGQFMPYNEIVAGRYASATNPKVTNQTDVRASELPDSDPRKGEELHIIPQSECDYFFGMEMSASFTQTADGLDAWGHDIIFEFSGDDDFWFYVDGELVLDLGGVHSADDGSVNFRTGAVSRRRETTTVNTTLYDLFRSNYETRGLNEAEIAAKLEEIFEEKTVDGKKVHVFRDFSNHTMRIFYMERGASASNLHLRFNLAAVKPGTFLLSKKLSGTDSPSNDLIEFPYQIVYRSQADSAWHLLGERTGEAEGVTYAGTTAQVTYKESFTPAGGTEAYEHVFMLKPGQTAQVEMPDDIVDYYVVECGVNPEVYDVVKANGTTLNGLTIEGAEGEEDTPLDITTHNLVGDTVRHDYRTSAATLSERSKVEYDNHVAPGAMRSLSFTKQLYNVDGETRLGPDQDDSTFTFRLYLGNESASADNLPLANLYPYYVKDPDGNYCRWDMDQAGFVSLGISSYDELKTYLATLSNAQRERIVFHTSMNGSVSRIPVDYTVEVHDLIVDTKFEVEERDYEIPKGYKLRVGDGYQLETENEKTGATTIFTDEQDATTPIVDTIEMNKNKRVIVNNQKGWGLTVEKVWTDKDFMELHDPIYFAVFVKDEGASARYEYDPREGKQRYSLVEVPNTVRRLLTSESELYYFFDSLENGKDFSDYAIFEVELTGDYTVDATTGKVSGYTSVTPIEHEGTLEIGGRPVGGTYSADGYVYTTLYHKGQLSTNNRNVRTDTVTNSRPGIEIYKTDWAGEALKGATFTLVDDEGRDVAVESYTSNKSGLVTTAYLSEGRYTLTETKTPDMYAGLPGPLTIEIGRDDDGNDTVVLSGVDSKYYTLEMHENGTMTATITIKNRMNELNVLKVDAATGEPLEGTHFALHRQVTSNDGDKVKALTPMEGYEDLVTKADGTLEEITMDLNPGTYYLCEKEPAAGYNPLSEDLCFSIGRDGIVRILTEACQGWLTEQNDSETGHVTFTITLPNEQTKPTEILKVDVLSNEPLEGAEFALYAEADCDANGTPKSNAFPIISGVTDADGKMGLGELANGVYYLAETDAPDGYNKLATTIKVSVNSLGVAAMQSGSQAVVVAPADGNNAWTIRVWNSAGYELPHTGGRGTIGFTFFGTTVVLGAGTLLLRRRA